MGIYPMAISQSEHDKFPWGRIKYSVHTLSICSLQIVSKYNTKDQLSRIYFNYRQWMFIFVPLFPDISIKLTKLYFQSWKKVFSNDFTLFS